jgi:flavin reductase (DIM6/NTAB) family NADH-FMN oxidoreductase RutF
VTARSAGGERNSTEGTLVSGDRKTRDQAFRQIPYGLYIVGSVDAEGIMAIVANWVTQVSFHPPLVAIAIEKDSKMRKCIEASRHFSINVLPSGSKSRVKDILRARNRHTAGERGGAFTLSRQGIPFLIEASASLGCLVTTAYPTGDHMTFIGEVVDASSRKNGEVLTLRETGWRYQR